MDKLRLEKVTYRYDVGTAFEQTALDDVTLSIEEGKITGIIGHTGSGKSTMMKLLNGLDHPAEGKVYLDGVDLNAEKKDLLSFGALFEKYQNLPKSARKKAILREYAEFKKNLCFRVGLVMQYPEYQLFEETVAKDIAFGPKNMGLSDEEIEKRVKEAALLTGVTEDLFEKSPFDLSGGQKRRVALAGVMAMKPEVLVLDEPAAGLDPRGRNHIFASILDYRNKTGSTVVIVSHSMEDMAKYCDRVVVMNHARVAMEGDRKEVFAHVKELSGMGLDIPEITRLAELLRERGIPLTDAIYTVEEATSALLSVFGKGGAEL